MQKIKDLLKIPAIAFAISSALLLVSILIANLLYQPKKMLKRGFQIEISADGKPLVKKEEKPIDIAALLKSANVDNGAKIFKKCASCHTIGKGEAAKVGPNLFGIVARKKAATSGFAYSVGLKAKGGVWDIESINQMITKPKDFIPGTKMGFPGLKKPQDRADVIFYLQQQK